MVKKRKGIQTVVKIIPLNSPNSGYQYWQSQSFESRLSTLGEIRTEYHRWRGNAQPRLKEFIRLLNDNQVRYMVVGGHAVALHGYPRYTKDIDIWIELTLSNASHILEVLKQYGFESLGLMVTDFLAEDQVIQLGYPPNRIDIITSLHGVTIADCYETR